MIDYDPHDWDSHLFDLRGSMVREILGRVAACVLWSAFVVFLYYIKVPVGMPSTIHTMVGTALGLLLVFRTNSSYDRFWEGRKLWGSITNETRNLGRLARVWLAGDRALMCDVLRLTTMFAYATKAVLRGGSDLGPTEEHLPAKEVAEIRASNHVGVAVAAKISGRLREARERGLISDIIYHTIDQNVQLLVDCMGGCERIHKTPIPYPYMVHLRRALILYCFSLPFALVRDFGWVTILDTLLVSYVFFGIEEIGVEIEDPFGEDDNDLNLDRFCRGIAEVLEGLRVDESAG